MNTGKVRKVKRAKSSKKSPRSGAIAAQPYPNQEQRVAMRPDTESKSSKNARFN